MTMSLKRLCLAGAILFAPCAAHAQYQMASPMLYEGPRISLENHARQSQSPTKPADKQAAPAPNPAPDPAKFKYVPSPERRKKNLAQFVAKSRAADPQGAASLEALFAQGDIIERLRPELAKHGLDVNNVADAYVLWWINAWQASRGINDDVSPLTVVAVRKQVMASLTGTTGFGAADDATKQEMAESLIIQSILLSAAVDQSKGKPDQMKAVQSAATQGARGMGLDLSAMNLTEGGFVAVPAG